MKATLYEALGIPQAASDEEVRASLRRLIRKYYAKTRDGQGNVEEALRFINHASRILSDSDRRKRYNNELALSAGTTEQKIAHGLALHQRHDEVERAIGFARVVEWYDVRMIQSAGQLRLANEPFAR